MSARGWSIVGQGLAGTCLAWELWLRGEPFTLLDQPQPSSSTRVAAGIINPITGKNFEPSWRLAEFLPEALAHYAAIEAQLGSQIWHPMAVLRLAASPKEWAKIQAKLAAPAVAPWVAGKVAPPTGWTGAVALRGGGRVDTVALIDRSREFFRQRGCYETATATADTATTIWCDGAAGLIAGRLGHHRCAKGEILTLRASGWDESSIRIGAGGWLVPLGGGVFRAGSTYEWNELDARPTTKGQQRVLEIIAQLGGGSDYEVTAHVAGIRPIVRQSQPLIGPLAGGGWVFNGLGSKGALYAPGIAARLAKWLVEATPPEATVRWPLQAVGSSRVEDPQ
jgi:glycine oxidase